METPYERYEYAGVIVEIVQDDEPGGYGPQDNDNAGTIYSWNREWDGDERISEPDAEECPNCGGPEGYPAEHAVGCPLHDQPIDLALYMRWNYDAALTIPLRFSDYGSSGARVYEDDSDPNCALCFTQKEIDEEWGGSRAEAISYATARIDELDMWMQGYVFGIVIRERSPVIEAADDDQGEVLESVWGFIGEPDSSWIREEAAAMASSCAAGVERERAEVAEWAARDVVTV